ncbi:hypothetical protein AMTR_s00092p00177270, partial [Amborella trichopoda]
MVKTVLHELVKLRGTAITGHLSMVPIDLEPQPIILAHINLNLQTLAAARMLTPSGPIDKTQWGDSVYNGPSPATHSTDAQLKVDIFLQLHNASEAFRTFIRYGLEQMERNTAAGRTPSSMPMSTTPPPVAINLSSPKLALMSPVHLKQQHNVMKPHELTNNSLVVEVDDAATMSSRDVSSKRLMNAFSELRKQLPIPKVDRNEKYAFA